MTLMMTAGAGFAVVAGLVGVVVMLVMATTTMAIVNAMIMIISSCFSSLCLQYFSTRIFRFR